MADRLGLSFEPATDHTLHRDYGHAVFEKGRSRKGSNSIYGGMLLAGRRIVLSATYRQDGRTRRGLRLRHRFRRTR